MLAWGLGAIAVGCESEGIRPGFDRSSAGAPNGEAGAPTSENGGSAGHGGDAGHAGAPNAGEAGRSGDAEGGTTAAGGAPANGMSGAPASDAGEGGTRDTPGEAGTTSSGGAAAGGTPGMDLPGEGGAAGATAEGGAAGATTQPSFPCEIRAIIESKCQRCHQDPQQHGAPFALLTWSDTRAEYGVQLVHEAMLPAIESDFMPYTALDLDPPVQPLSSVEKRTMLDWLEAGAEPADEPRSCN